MNTESSGHRPLVSFWATLMIGVLLAVSPGRGLAQKRAADGRIGRASAASAVVGASSSVSPASALDTTGLWHFAEQRRVGRYKVRLPSRYGESAAHYRLVLLLHGNGNNPQMLMDWFGGLGLDSLIVVAPEAPYTKIPETVAKGRGVYTGVADAAWAPDSIRGESIVMTADWYASVIEDAMARMRCDTSRAPLIVGFSQGGYFAHVLLTRSRRPLAGVASICASHYPQYDVLQRYASITMPHPPVFVAHGTRDAVVPPSFGEAYKYALETVGFPVVFHPFDGGHWPTPAVDAALRAWIMSIIR